LANVVARDSARYRTPYAAWGGFTNGYEGNLRAHLMQTQSSAGAGDILSGIPQHLLQPLADTGLGLLAPSPLPQFAQPESTGSDAAEASAGMHPAIRPHFTGAWQQQPAQPQPTPAVEAPPQPRPVAKPMSTTPVPIPTFGMVTKPHVHFVEKTPTPVAPARAAEQVTTKTSQEMEVEVDDDASRLADVPPDWPGLMERMLANMRRTAQAGL
jgi:hypothetical protein